MSYTQSFYKMLLWGPLETWKPVCVWKKPSHTLINNLNGSHTFSEPKHGSWNCTANSLDCIKSPLRVCVSYDSFHLDGAFASRMNWLEQPVGTSFCELDRDRSGSKAKDVANGSLPHTGTWADFPWNQMWVSGSSSADTISTIRPFCENGT